MSYQWDFSFVARGWPLLLQGLIGTMQLSAVALVAGLLIGLVVGVGRTARIGPVRWAATAYVEIFRNTPILVQLLWVFYVLPILTGWQSPRFLAAATAPAIYTGAYAAEIYRAGIESVERGQWEAATP